MVRVACGMSEEPIVARPQMGSGAMEGMRYQSLEDAPELGGRAWAVSCVRPNIVASGSKVRLSRRFLPSLRHEHLELRVSESTCSVGRRRCRKQVFLCPTPFSPRSAG